MFAVFSPLFDIMAASCGVLMDDFVISPYTSLAYDARNTVCLALPLAVNGQLFDYMMYTGPFQQGAPPATLLDELPVPRWCIGVDVQAAASVR